MNLCRGEGGTRAGAEGEGLTPERETLLQTYPFSINSAGGGAGARGRRRGRGAAQQVELRWIAHEAFLT